MDRYNNCVASACEVVRPTPQVQVDLNTLNDALEGLDKAIDKLSGELDAVRYLSTVGLPPAVQPSSSRLDAAISKEPARCSIADRLATMTNLVTGMTNRVGYIKDTLQV